MPTIYKLSTWRNEIQNVEQFYNLRNKSPINPELADHVH